MKRLPMVTKLKNKLKSNPKVNLVEMNLPMTNGLPTPKLKDVLESEVDEKYYLRNDVVERIIKESNFEERLVSLKTEKKQCKQE
jgi:hypothetical protein